MKVVSYIDQGLCIGCKICIEVCPMGVFVMSGEKAVVMNPEKCNGCEICVENCPVDAITLKWTDL
ncbi:iron sulfur cluster binding protein (4Fe-4S ferredoxin family protein) [Desulfurobacterium thermolithotrophum DSM 11699]|uniref:Iron sulfur cluster binding protein (4Fe-4S ferredoxin family protein) n=1 Tax=Desulfurobacterium thermolithotrophum (strain DSM 11699 / BSA) TaxID=868864 RepID=F0S2L7_DESTD|nr:4Fe-4S binding protein [Desulfurobacterium thermolithotrophum]ADY73089.1 iron sulfur cluster binding protein (4Fe-4S ferredoxin family protein) [Desulfurobacterium thermolithotrophum DSM 11699]